MKIKRITPNYYTKRIFTDEQELELKEYILTCSRMFYSLPIKECGCIAFEMATVNKIYIYLIKYNIYFIK